MEDLNDLRKILDSYLGLVFKIGLVLVVLATFFLFTNLTTEFYDTPKFLVLAVFAAALLILLTLRFTLTGKVVFIRTPLDIPLLLLLAVGIVSTLLSPAFYVSLLGNQLKLHGSLVSLIVYILFYFLLVNNLKNWKEAKGIFTIIIFAAQILAAITLLSYFGLNLLPAPWNGVNFTPTGSTFSTAAILTLLLPLTVSQILTNSNPLVKITNSVFFAISGITIALTGTWPIWVAAIAGLALSFFTSDLRNLNNLGNLSFNRLISLAGLGVPLVIIALALLLSFVPPVGGIQNPIYAKSQSYPREIQLPFVTAWKISVSAFRDLPFWGTGPGTFLFNFTNYKPVEFNASKFWNLRFDSSFNEYFQILATLGGVGILALLSLTVFFISSASSAILNLQKAREESLAPSDKQKISLAISGIVFFIILALHPSSLALWVIGLLILASFMVTDLTENMQKSWGNTSDLKNMFFKIAANVTSHNPSKETIRVDALPGVLLTISLALVIFAGFFGGKLVFADFHHRQALNAVAANQGLIAYNELVAAEKLNPYNDLYRTDLAQTNFALASAIVAAKGPTEASPAGFLTDQDKQNIQILLQQSINEGKIATTLSPRSAMNWEILALLYRQISGVAQNALAFSLDSYGRAIFQDPLNPQLRVNVGGVYYAVKNYDLAIRFFTDAINLKADFANGYYNLSVALRDKGDLNTAQVIAERLLTLIEPSSPDYKTANDYLTDLKNRIAEGSKPAENPVPAEPPAAQASGTLEQKELPKVINLPKPDKIATPEAVKKPAASPTPASTPTPSLSPSPEATANP